MKFEKIKLTDVIKITFIILYLEWIGPFLDDRNGNLTSFLLISFIVAIWFLIRHNMAKLSQDES